MAAVGNGHVATVVYSPTIYMNGLYNGPVGKLKTFLKSSGLSYSQLFHVQLSETERGPERLCRINQLNKGVN